MKVEAQSSTGLSGAPCPRARPRLRSVADRLTGYRALIVLGAAVMVAVLVSGVAFSAGTTFTVSNTNDSGAGSLRQAILDANANAGADTIAFAISGTGVHTITPTLVLPTITEAVTIDATTDDSFASNSNRPAIIVDGNNLVADGLTLGAAADGSTIRGLVVRDFGGNGILIEAGSDGNTVAGNYVGRLDAAGTIAAAGEENTSSGIRVLGASNTIGGTTALDRNLSRGNVQGIYLTGASASGNTILNNYVGVDVTGNSAVTNSGRGIHVDGGASSNLIGKVGYGNVVSGSTNIGIHLIGGSNNVIRANIIGLNAAGSAAISTEPSASRLTAALGDMVGGSAAGEGNVISGNTGSVGSVAGGGVYIQATNSTVQGNIIGLDPPAPPSSRMAAPRVRMRASTSSTARATT